MNMIKHFPETTTIEVVTSDDHRIDVNVADPGADQCVLMLHGITSERTEDGLYSTIARGLTSTGTAAAVFDFRGHGQSAIPFEKATAAGMVLDFAAVYRDLRARYARVDLLCASFGASIALLGFHVLDSEPTRAAVLLNPVLSYSGTFAKATTRWGQRFFPQVSQPTFWDKNEHDTGDGGLRLGREMMTQVAILAPELMSFPNDISLTIIHGTSDDIVDISFSDAYALRHERNTVLIRIEGASHGFEGFEDRIVEETIRSLVLE